MEKSILFVLIVVLLSSTMIVANAENSLPLSSFFMYSQNAIPPSGGINQVTADDGIYAISYTDDQNCNGSSDSCDCCIIENGRGCCLCSDGPQWTWHKFVFEIPDGKSIASGTFKWNGKSTYYGWLEYRYSVYLAEELDYWCPYIQDPITGTFPIGEVLNNPNSESDFTYSLTSNDISLINQNRRAVFYVDNKDCSTGYWSLQSDYVELIVTLVDTPSLGITSSIIASPLEVYKGEDINVMMTVQNLGSAPANNVIPSQLITFGDGKSELVSGPNPSSIDIAPGSQSTFTWTYRATKSGEVSFGGNATADGGLSSDETISNSIQIKNTELDDKKEKLEVVHKIVRARLNHLNQLLLEIESKIGPKSPKDILEKLNLAKELIEEAKKSTSPSKANKLLNEAKEILNEILRSLK